jgi:hypothetical protein
MLFKTGTYIGKVGLLDYYILDGRIWAIDDGEVVLRSDDDDETQQILEGIRNPQVVDFINKIMQ